MEKQKATSKAETSELQLVVASNGDNARCISDDNDECSSDNVGHIEHKLSQGDVSDVVNTDRKEYGSETVLVSVGNQGTSGTNGDLGGKLVTDLNYKLSNHDYSTPLPGHAPGTDPVVSNCQEIEGIETSIHKSIQNHGDLSDDFANTFMLDEELELEQKTRKSDGVSSVRRYYMLLYLFDSLHSSFCLIFLHQTFHCSV